ncbi:unnamed protein product [Dicrocoelium dendriticum]|nr:unnamed protein product [Dicrocoelium dendriticum]
MLNNTRTCLIFRNVGKSVASLDFLFSPPVLFSCEIITESIALQSTFTKNSDVQLTQVQKHPDGDTLIIRQIENDMMTTTASVRNVTSVRKYQRV